MSLPAIATTPAPCQRDEQMTCLVYRWALGQVEADRWPALQVRWVEPREDGDIGEMACCVVPHDALMQPEGK